MTTRHKRSQLSGGGGKLDALESSALLDDGTQLASESALEGGGPVDIYATKRLGYLGQYFAVGLISGGLPATVYGLYMQYLNVPAHIYATAGTIMTLPWAFKFAFGMINDCVPIWGYRRKPYMCIGWTFCSIMLVVLANTSLPAPYWCTDAEGKYVHTIAENGNTTSSGGKQVVPARNSFRERWAHHMYATPGGACL